MSINKFQSSWRDLMFESIPPCIGDSCFILSSQIRIIDSNRAVFLNSDTPTSTNGTWGGAYWYTWNPQTSAAWQGTSNAMWQAAVGGSAQWMALQSAHFAHSQMSSHLPEPFPSFWRASAQLAMISSGITNRWAMQSGKAGQKHWETMILSNAHMKSTLFHKYILCPSAQQKSWMLRSTFTMINTTCTCTQRQGPICCIKHASVWCILHFNCQRTTASVVYINANHILTPQHYGACPLH